MLFENTDILSIGFILLGSYIDHFRFLKRRLIVSPKAEKKEDKQIK